MLPRDRNYKVSLILGPYRPTSFKISKGFTLIELLVVIAIIAIIATVGIVIYSGQTKNARDARRRADIASVADAMEAQHPVGAVNYPVMANTYFASQVMPLDPTNTLSGVTSTCGTVCEYCFSLSATPITNCTGGSSNFWTTTAAPAAWTISPTWTVCANLETTPATSYCRSNAQ